MVVDQMREFVDRKYYPKPIHHADDLVLVYSGDAYLANQKRLTGIAVHFANRELSWTKGTARRILKPALQVTDSEDKNLIPSVLLFGREALIRRRPIFECVGISAQRELYIPTSEGDIKVLYHGLRAFEPAFRKQGRGRWSIEIARLIHPDSEFYVHRSAAPPAFWANMSSGLFGSDYYPLLKPYPEDPIAQEVAEGVFNVVRIDGKSINRNTGVSIADYPELNRSYIPNPKHVPTMEILKRMKEVLKMKIERGDSLYATGKFHNPSF